MRKATTVLVTALLGSGAVMAIATPASAGHSACGTVDVSTDKGYEKLFARSAANDTRATGHYDLVRDGLRLWTESNTGTDKVTGYHDLKRPVDLADQNRQADYDLVVKNTSNGSVPG